MQITSNVEGFVQVKSLRQIKNGPVHCVYMCLGLTGMYDGKDVNVYKATSLKNVKQLGRSPQGVCLGQQAADKYGDKEISTVLADFTLRHTNLVVLAPGNVYALMGDLVPTLKSAAAVDTLAGLNDDDYLRLVPRLQSTFLASPGKQGTINTHYPTALGGFFIESEPVTKDTLIAAGYGKVLASFGELLEA